jgi:hypothetical protein
MEIISELAGDPYIKISPASGACLATGYRNRGGTGPEAMRGLAGRGVCTSRLWPDAAIDSRYDTEESRAERERFKVIEFDDFDSRDFDAQFSALLYGEPWSGGYNHMSHQITALDPLWIDGGPAIRFNNSWKVGVGINSSRLILKGERMAAADDAIRPRMVIPSVG